MDWAAYMEWRPDFSAAMDARLHTPEWLDQQFLAGRVQLWADDRAAVVTEIRTFPTGAYDVHGLVAAGDARAVRDTIVPRIERWARAIGAIDLTVESRPGWARLLRASGFVEHQLQIRKAIGR